MLKPRLIPNFSRVSYDCPRTPFNGRLDILVAIGSFALHCDKNVARIHPTRVILDTTNVHWGARPLDHLDISQSFIDQHDRILLGTATQKWSSDATSIE
jgi:hypothetical protein